MQGDTRSADGAIEAARGIARAGLTCLRTCTDWLRHGPGPAADGTTSATCAAAAAPGIARPDGNPQRAEGAPATRCRREPLAGLSLATPLFEPTHGQMRLLGSAGAPTRSQQSNTDQQMSFRNRWSSSTSSRIASGSWSRCHRHSSRPARSPSPSGAAARAALIA